MIDVCDNEDPRAGYNVLEDVFGHRIPRVRSHHKELLNRNKFGGHTVLFSAGERVDIEMTDYATPRSSVSLYFSFRLIPEFTCFYPRSAKWRSKNRIESSGMSGGDNLGCVIIPRIECNKYISSRKPGRETRERFTHISVNEGRSIATPSIKATR